MQCSGMPYQRIILGPRYSVRLEDVQATDAIEAECLNCGRKRLIAPHRLHARFQSYMLLQQIGKEMQCSVCGRGTLMVWNAVRASPD